MLESWDLDVVLGGAGSPTKDYIMIGINNGLVEVHLQLLKHMG